MPQKLIFVPDSFKGSLSAQRACQLMAQAAEAALPGMPCVSIPIADGGEGTTDAFLAAAGGDRIPCTVTGPWGEPVDACYGRLPGEGRQRPGFRWSAIIRTPKRPPPAVWAS